jgi:hypothetical protein
LEWTTVKGFEDYEATECGRIRRKDKVITRDGHKPFLMRGKELEFTFDKDGYHKTALRKHGKRHYFRVHRIIADTFIPNPNNLPIVNHKNGIKHDNQVDNLEWCTYSENVIHGFEVLGRVGYNGGQNVPVLMIDPISGKVLNRFESMLEAGIHVGVTNITISACVKGRLNTAGGYKWVRASEGVSTIEKAE